MGIIQVQGVTKQLGGRIVLNDISLDFHSGDIVGLIGGNGAGKTTLFRLIAGVTTPDFGTVSSTRGMEIGYLPQEPEIALGNTLHDEVLSVFAEVLALEKKLERISEQMAEHQNDGELAGLMAEYDRVNAEFTTAGGYGFERRLNEILGGLGFSQSDYSLPMTALSGGQKCRVSLAKLLLQESQFLLLDEPTNHLDIDAVRWLEKFLASYGGGAIIISHDRYLLDRVTQRIVEIEGGRTVSYTGNYTAFAQTKALLRLTQERQFEKDQEFIEKERAFIAKFLAGQRSQEAKGRRTKLERRIKAGEFVSDRPDERESIKLEFAADSLEGRTVIDVREMSKRFDDKVLFDDLSFAVLGGERMGITGPNGTGKSILLKSVLGKIKPDGGEVIFDPKTDIGYYAQEVAALNPQHTILEEIRAARPAMNEQAARSYLGRFFFRNDDVFKQIGQLSGGEQSRVRLITLILKAPNVLVLDEPTNHLDIPSREALEEALQEFPGAMIAVSHDRYFLDRLADRLLVMRAGKHQMYDGNYSFYITQIEAEAEAAAKAREAAERKAAAARAGQKKDAAKKTKSRSPYARLTMEQLETQIAERERKVAEINARYADTALYKDPVAVARLGEELTTARAELATMEEEWLGRTAETE